MDYCNDSDPQSSLAVAVNVTLTSLRPVLTTEMPKKPKTEVKLDDDIVLLYKIFVPILLVLCVMGLVFNGILVAVGSLKRSGLRSRSPILILSLNLAATDSLASFLFAFSLFFNSYLPVVYKYDITGRWRCVLAVVEILRLSSLVASAMHLLSLALVHYKGIVNPLHYRSVIFCSQHRTRSIYLMSFICWFIPVTILSVYFSSIPCQGFQSPDCSTKFFAYFNFRVIVVSEFFIPLMFMFFLYIRIFIIIKRHQEQRLTRQQSCGPQSSSARSRLTSTGSLLDASVKRKKKLLSPVRDQEEEEENGESVNGHHRTNSLHNTVLRTQSEKGTPNEQLMMAPKVDNCNLNNSPNGLKKSATNRRQSLYRISGAIGNILNRSGSKLRDQRDQRPQQHPQQTLILNNSTSLSAKCEKLIPSDNGGNDSTSSTPAATTGHAKALVTTLLILGTYILCWMPAVLSFGLTCTDYCPFPITSLNLRSRIFLGFSTNCLVIFKTLIDPFIYTYRMKEMKAALNRYVRLPFADSPLSRHPPPPQPQLRQVMHPPNVTKLRAAQKFCTSQSVADPTGNSLIVGRGSAVNLHAQKGGGRNNCSTVIALNSDCTTTATAIAAKHRSNGNGNASSAAACDL